MADRPTEPAATRAANRGREDTVAIPRPPMTGDAANWQAGSPTGSQAGRVMPPLPAQPSNGTSNGHAHAAPAESGTPTAATPPPAPVIPPAPELDPSRRTASHTAAPVAPAPAAPTRQQRRAAAQRARAEAQAPRPGRRARLRLSRIDPWSVMKTAFLLSIALGIVTVVSVLMVWTVLGAADVWSSIDKTVRDVLGNSDTSFKVEDYIGTRRVVGFTIIVAAVDVVLVTAICTLGAFLYNMSASLLGGIEVTLAEDG